MKGIRWIARRAMRGFARFLTCARNNASEVMLVLAVASFTGMAAFLICDAAHAGSTDLYSTFTYETLPAEMRPDPQEELAIVGTLATNPDLMLALQGLTELAAQARKESSAPAAASSPDSSAPPAGPQAETPRERLMRVGSVLVKDLSSRSGVPACKTARWVERSADIRPWCLLEPRKRGTSKTEKLTAILEFLMKLGGLL